MRASGKQRGAALIVTLLILVLGIATLLTRSLNSLALQLARDADTLNALSHAREALIGDAVAQMPITSAGYLRLPDLGFKIGMLAAEGSAAPNFSGNSKDYSVLGKLPWRSLGLEPLRDGQEECLWYLVSGRFKNTPLTDALNWDTPGQIDLADANGNVIASNLAALVIAPGSALDGQNRALADPAYTQCGGNYDAHNYLDPYNASDTLSGASNYFGGSSNDRVALDSNNKLLLMARSDHYNDRFLFITGDDIFRALIHRADFSAQVSALLNDAYFQSVAIAGTKGSDNINCNSLSSNNRTFCKNWKDMLLLTQLPSPAAITIDGLPTAVCSRVLIFGGQKNAAQLRLSATDKANPANYIEGANLSAFATPLANTGNFGGTSMFSASNPSADLLKCLP